MPGWFYADDQALMSWFLDHQDRTEPPGDLLELGAYLGKSAILIGHHVRAGERLTVCDLFDSPAPDEANVAEMTRSYSTLTRDTFELNYLSFHDELPLIVQGPTSIIASHVAAGSCRFIHVDASHLYEHVHADIEASRKLLRDDGLVVCDDYRSAHTPGVAAAVWAAVAVGGLRPICLSPYKFYGTWGDPTRVQDELLEWLSGQGSDVVDVQMVAGRRLVRVDNWRNPPRPRYGSKLNLPPARTAKATKAAGGPANGTGRPMPSRGAHPPNARSWPKAMAKDLLPPVVTRAIQRARRTK